MQDGRSWELFAVEETQYRVTPAAALQGIRQNSFNLDPGQELARPSPKGRSQYPNQLIRSEGTTRVPTPWVFRNAQMFDEGLLGSDVAPVAVAGADLSFASATGQITTPALGTDLTAIEPGDLIYISGSGVPANNGWKGPVLSSGQNVVELPSNQVEDEAAGPAISIGYERLAQGSLIKSYTIERKTGGGRFRSAPGYGVRSATYTLQSDGIATADYELMGHAFKNAAVTLGTGAPILAPSFEPFTFASGWGELFLDETLSPLIVSRIVLNVESTLYAMRGGGDVDGPRKLGIGALTVSLEATVVVDDAEQSLFDLVAGAESLGTISAWGHIQDKAGNRTAFLLPAARIQSPTDDISDQMVEYQLTLSAHDPALDASSPYNAKFGGQLAFFHHPAA